MASKRNPQVAIVNSSAASITAIQNPSSTAFLYVWRVQLTANAATLLTFEQSTVQGTVALSGPFDLTGAGGSVTKNEGQSPHYTVDPAGSLLISNSGTAGIAGEILWSN
jgi:hypothetical protein